MRPLAEAIEARAAQRRRAASDRLVRAVGRYYVQRGMDHALALTRPAPR